MKLDFGAEQPKRLAKLNDSFYEQSYQDIVSVLAIEKDLEALSSLTDAVSDYMFGQITAACLYSRSLLKEPTFDIKAINAFAAKSSSYSNTGNERGNLLVAVIKLWHNLHVHAKFQCDRDTSSEFVEKAESLLEDILMRRRRLRDYYLFIEKWTNTSRAGTPIPFSHECMRDIDAITTSCDECCLVNPLSVSHSGYNPWPWDYSLNVICSSFLHYMDWYNAIISISVPSKETLVLWVMQQLLSESDFLSWLHCGEYQQQLVSSLDKENRLILESDSSEKVKELLVASEAYVKIDELRGKLLESMYTTVYDEFKEAGNVISSAYFSSNEISSDPIRSGLNRKENQFTINFDLKLYESLRASGLKNEFYQQMIDSIEHEFSGKPNLYGSGRSLTRNDINCWMKAIELWMDLGAGEGCSMKSFLSIFPEVTKKHFRPLLIAHMLKFDIEVLPDIININMFENIPDSSPSVNIPFGDFKRPKGVDTKLFGGYLTKFFNASIHNKFITKFMEGVPENKGNHEKWYKAQYRSSILKNFFENNERVNQFKKAIYRPPVKGANEYDVGGHYFPVGSGYLMPLWFINSSNQAPESVTEGNEAENVISGDFDRNK